MAVIAREDLAKRTGLSEARVQVRIWQFVFSRLFFSEFFFALIDLLVCIFSPMNFYSICLFVAYSIE